MKKGGKYIVFTISIAFTAFLLGMLIGRITSSGQVVIHNYHAAKSGATAAPSPSTVPSQATQNTTATSGKININTATLEQLVTLPGIGPALAQRILDHRTDFGAFSKIEELYDIPGIGEKKLAAIADLITLEDET